MFSTLMTAQTIIWDWNGTLIDDVKICWEIINRGLERRSLNTISLEEYLESFEFPVENFYRKLGFDFEKESFHTVGTEFIEAYRIGMFQCPLHTGALNALKIFQEQGKRQFILSALESKSLFKVTEFFGLSGFFSDLRGLDHFFATSKVGLGKSLLQEHSQDPSKAVMIGDTLHDYEVAQELGVQSILISGGHNSYQRLKTTGVPVFRKIEEFRQGLRRTIPHFSRSHRPTSS